MECMYWAPSVLYFKGWVLQLKRPCSICHLTCIKGVWVHRASFSFLRGLGDNDNVWKENERQLLLKVMEFNEKMYPKGYWGMTETNMVMFVSIRHVPLKLLSIMQWVLKVSFIRMAESDNTDIHERHSIVTQELLAAVRVNEGNGNGSAMKNWW